MANKFQTDFYAAEKRENEWFVFAKGGKRIATIQENAIHFIDSNKWFGIDDLKEILSLMSEIEEQEKQLF